MTYPSVEPQPQFPALESETLAYWANDKTFEASIAQHEAGANGENEYVFYDGPPFANGLPHYGHLLTGFVKDAVPRYQTMRGKRVERRFGWDCHGLPAEAEAERQLGISGTQAITDFGIEKFNDYCKVSVLQYTSDWERYVTRQARWVDFANDYKTLDMPYMESVMWAFKTLWDKGLIYEGFRVLPYSWALETPLSNTETRMDDAYKQVQDPALTVGFVLENGDSLLAWTTTPWTLPSNLALAVSPDVEYVRVSHEGKVYVIAQARLEAYAKELEGAVVLETVMGSTLVGMRYTPLFPYFADHADAFRVLSGEFVTTEDGTGVVHMAPGFGEDDQIECNAAGIPTLCPMDEHVCYTAEITPWVGKHVFEANSDIVRTLKDMGIVNRHDSYNHSYPHCWRTDKPILYYPLDSWFIKTTAVKDRMVELNKTINWKPEATGTGRFGNWLQNLVDWNLSRSRYWGTPLPIWRSEDGSEELCIGSIDELKANMTESLASAVPTAEQKVTMQSYLSALENGTADMHRPYVDDVVLVSATGKALFRETDLIDVWFDSGAMPYAQWHYPFENKEEFANAYPADFIAEGVDQTRGWFFTLHAIAVMLNDSVAFKNVLSNGLVLDKNGNKMSKRLGNAADPFETIETYSADASRWYMISNASPWDNLKFNLEGLDEVRRKFFGTLYNTYSFFALYANIDRFSYKEPEMDIQLRPEIDRWIISLLNSLIKEVDGYYEDFEPTKAARAIQSFVDEHLSNWYVRLCRRRFWKGEYTEDKISAYQTLYTCLSTISKLMSPIAPFYADRLFLDLNEVSGKESVESVHLADFPAYQPNLVDVALEERMALAQHISSLTLSLRKKVSINVRQPLSKILLPVINKGFQNQVEQVKELILSETNIKDIEFITDAGGFISKKVKPNFKTLGPKVGQAMKEVAAVLTALSQEEIARFEKEGTFAIPNTSFVVDLSDVEMMAEDVPGWQVATLGALTVALDIHVSEELKQEGIARELVNRIQNLRKDQDFLVTDRIQVRLSDEQTISPAVNNNLAYICAEILADSLVLESNLNTTETFEIDDIKLFVSITKV